MHAAGIPSPKHYFKKPIEAIFTSITGTKKLLEYSKKNKSKFIFFSSSEIYGNPDKKNIPTKLIMAMYHPLKIDLVMTKVKESVKLYVIFIKLKKM